MEDRIRARFVESLYRETESNYIASCRIFWAQEWQTLILKVGMGPKHRNWNWESENYATRNAWIANQRCPYFTCPFSYSFSTHQPWTLDGAIESSWRIPLRCYHRQWKLHFGRSTAAVLLGRTSEAKEPCLTILRRLLSPRQIANLDDIAPEAGSIPTTWHPITHQPEIRELLASEAIYPLNAHQVHQDILSSWWCLSLSQNLTQANTTPFGI